MTKLKDFANNWLPPVFVSWLKKKRNETVSYAGEYTSWAEAVSLSTGYSSSEILEKVLSASFKVKNGDAEFERDSVTFDKAEYSWPVLANLMWAAARNGGHLKVLDFGGALGSSYFQYRRFLNQLRDVTWNVVEQSHYVEAGKLHFQTEHLQFYESIEESVNASSPTVILLSSTLQYLSTPLETIDLLSATGADCLIIDRTPFSSEPRDKVVIQSIPSSIYRASYPMWVFSREEMTRKLEANWSLVAANSSPEGHAESTGGVKFSFEGLFLESIR